MLTEAEQQEQVHMSGRVEASIAPGQHANTDLAYGHVAHNKLNC
jgi:hypothetical protein